MGRWGAVCDPWVWACVRRRPCIFMKEGLTLWPRHGPSCGPRPLRPHGNHLPALFGPISPRPQGRADCHGPLRPGPSQADYIFLLLSLINHSPVSWPGERGSGRDASLG